VGLWGYLLYQVDVDPLGGVKTQLAQFRNSNHNLAALAHVQGYLFQLKMKTHKINRVNLVPGLLDLQWTFIIKK
ncbi:carbon starvation CstA family protein, partial [Enterobacter hormaechei]